MHNQQHLTRKCSDFLLNKYCKQEKEYYPLFLHFLAAYVFEVRWSLLSVIRYGDETCHRGRSVG